MTQFQTVARPEISQSKLMEGQIGVKPGAAGIRRPVLRNTTEVKARTPAIPTYRTRVASGSDALRATLAEIGSGAASTPFQTAAWLNAWLDTIGKARGCETHVAEIRDERTGALLFALPLVRRTSGMLRIIELPDFGLADYAGPLMTASFRPDRATMSRLWARVLADLPPADLLQLHRLPDRIGPHQNPLLLLAGLRRHAQSAWGLHLVDAPADFSALALPKKRVRELNKRFKRMEEVGPVEFRTAETPADIDRFFAAMCCQRARRHAQMGRPNSLDHADIRAFFRSMLADGALDATAAIQAVLVKDEIVATGYGLRSGNGFHVIFATIEDGPWRALSPGLQYFRMSMAWAYTAHHTYYDFTVGSEQYKAEIGAREMPLYEVCQPLSPLGRIAQACAATKRAIKSQPRLAQLLRFTARSLNLRSI